MSDTPRTDALKLDFLSDWATNKACISEEEQSRIAADHADRALAFARQLERELSRYVPRESVLEEAALRCERFVENHKPYRGEDHCPYCAAYTKAAEAIRALKASSTCENDSPTKE
jgi:hypothetical protein